MRPPAISAALVNGPWGPRRSRHAAPGLLLALLLSAGCGFGESGVPPPSDRIFLPTGLAMDPDGGWLYVVSSNFDLRYNAGTVSAVDLAKVQADRENTGWGDCPSPGFLPPDGSGHFCCHDYFDRETLNCSDRAYIDGSRTVRVGSFGGAAVLDPVKRNANGTRRLFVLVRAEPSVTFIDTTVSSTGVTFQCTKAGPGRDATCEDSYKLFGQRDSDAKVFLLEEPYTMALDEKLGLLHVGHLFSGVTSLDLGCADEHGLRSADPVISGFDSLVFGESPIEGVTSLTLAHPGDVDAPLFATGHTFTGGSARVSPLFLRPMDNSAPLACTDGGGGAAPGRRHFDLTIGQTFFSPAFYPAGQDIRGLVLSPDGSRMYLLHRNSGRSSPAALVAIDRSPDKNGDPVNRAIGAVEVCGGGTQLSWHDAGRGPRLYIVCSESGQVYVVDPQLLVVTAVINAGRGPNALTFSPMDPTIAFLTGFTDNNISVIDLKPGDINENRVVQRIGFPRAAGQ